LNAPGRGRLAEKRARFGAAMGLAPGVTDPRIAHVFTAVPREQFVGAGPWRLLTATGYVETPSADPSLLYEDVVVALAPDKRINNGQPSLHARCLSAAGIEPGDRVVHIGCGSGYYSAILAELTTGAGSVAAWDVEPTLAQAASRNLRAWPNVVVTLRSGTAPPIPASDVIYVSAGCTRPLRIWTDALAEGGRLIFPLTPGWDFGGILKITRQGSGYAAEFICRCSFIPCDGGSNPAGEERLKEAFSRGGMDQVSTLHFGSDPGEHEAWFKGDGWWLSSIPAARQ
jgi:protein-L-isoaspartate(D-aspartate) O-methyltransferase